MTYDMTTGALKSILALHVAFSQITAVQRKNKL